MSTHFTPSPSAVEGLGNAFSNLAVTIGGKLDQATMASQYNNGQEILRRSTNDFLQKLSQDTNTDGYSDKLSQFEDQTWKQLDKVVTHQGARNQLYQWWQGNRDTVESDVQAQSMKVQGQKALGLREATLNSVLASDMTAEQQKQKYIQTTLPLVQNGLIDPVTAEIDKANFFHSVDVQQATNGAFAFVKKKGLDGMPDFSGAHGFLADPKNTKGLSATEVDTIDKKITTMEHAQDYENQKANASTERNLTEIESAVLMGNGKLSDFLDAINKATFVGTTQAQAQAKLKWAKEYDAMVDELARRPKNTTFKILGDEDNPVLNDLLTQAMDPRAPNTEAYYNAITLKAMKAYHTDHTITDTQFEKIANAAKPRTDNRMARYELTLSAPAGSTDVVKNAFTQAKADFANYLNNNPTADSAQVDAYAQKVHDMAVKGIASKAGATYFSDAATAILGGAPITAGQPSGRPFETPQGQTPSPAGSPQYPKALTDKVPGITGVPTVKNGRTYYTDKAGKEYQVVKGVVVVWDGSTWQTLK